MSNTKVLLKILLSVSSARSKVAVRSSELGNNKGAVDQQLTLFFKKHPPFRLGCFRATDLPAHTSQVLAFPQDKGEVRLPAWC